MFRFAIAVLRFGTFPQSHRLASERRIPCPFRLALFQQLLAAFELCGVLFFLGAQTGKVFGNVVAVFRRNAVAHGADFFDGLVGCVHIQMSPSNSGGVTKSGVFKPSRVLTRRMWPNLFAFARCLQFHVTR